MSVRLFVGYFLVLAACATVALSSSGTDPSASPATAEAGMLPTYSLSDVSYRASFTQGHSRKSPRKRFQIAEAE